MPNLQEEVHHKGKKRMQLQTVSSDVWPEKCLLTVMQLTWELGVE